MKAINQIFERIYFLFIRRNLYNKKYANVNISIFSYIDYNSKISKNNVFHGRCTVYDSVISEYSYAVNAKIANTDMGKFCSIGPETIIGGLGRHPTEWISTHPIFYSCNKQAGISFAERSYFEELPRVKIGNDVWIGARVIILDGVNIGNGAIIAAGAIVTKNVEPYTIVGGIPARVIKRRMSLENSQIMENLNWWNWSEKNLKKYAHLFRIHVDDSLIEQLLEINNNNI